MAIYHEAVCLIINKAVIQTLSTAEFGAIKQGVMHLSNFCDQTLDAVYVQFDQSSKLQAVLCFALPFNASGSVAAGWQLPFEELLYDAEIVAGLSDHPLRVVTQSNCHRAWLAASLIELEDDWLALIQSAVNDLDPQAFSPSRGVENQVPVLQPISRAIEPQAVVDDIPLAVPTLSPASMPKQSAQAEQEQAAKREAQLQSDLEQLRSEHQLLQQRHQQTVSELQQKLQSTQQQHMDEIDLLRQQVADQQREYTSIAEKQHDEAAEFAAERSNLLDQLAEGQLIEQQKIAELKQAFDQELQSRLSQTVHDYKQQLVLREVELFYREEKASLLDAEISRLKQQNYQLLHDSDQRVLQQLHDSQVTFVAYHLGVGHITIALDDVARYLDDTAAFLAEYCKLSKSAFLAWLRHYESPQCEYRQGTQDACCKPLNRVELASDFVIGQSNICDQHRNA